MLRTVIKKVDSTQEQMDNVSREMETVTNNNNKKTLQIKSTVTEMKKTFNRLLSTLHTAKERIREFNSMPQKVPKLNKTK